MSQQINSGLEDAYMIARRDERISMWVFRSVLIMLVVFIVLFSYEVISISILTVVGLVFLSAGVYRFLSAIELVTTAIDLDRN